MAPARMQAEGNPFVKSTASVSATAAIPRGARLTANRQCRVILPPLSPGLVLPYGKSSIPGRWTLTATVWLTRSIISLFSTNAGRTRPICPASKQGTGMLNVKNIYKMAYAAFVPI